MKETHHTMPMSIGEGIEIQLGDLARWSKVLNEETYKYVVKEVTKHNDKARDGYDICRGDCITNIITSYAYYMHNNLPTYIAAGVYKAA